MFSFCFALRHVFLILLFFQVCEAHAIFVQSVKNGNWNDASCWSSNTVPLNNDSVTISHFINLINNVVIYSPSFIINTNGTICGNVSLSLIDSSVSVNKGVINLQRLFVKGPFQNEGLIVLKGGSFMEVSSQGSFYNKPPNGEVVIMNGEHVCDPNLPAVNCLLPRAQFSYFKEIDNSITFKANHGDTGVYEWSFGDSKFINENNKSLISHYYLDDGIYNVALVIRNACGVDSFNLTIEINNCNEIDAAIYPNPTEHIFMLEIFGCTVISGEYSIFDVIGNAITEKIQFSSNDGKLWVEIPGWSPACYFVMIEIEGKILTRKLMVVNNY